MVVVGLDISLTATAIADSKYGLNLVGATGILGLPLHDRIDAVDTLTIEILDSVSSRLVDGRIDLAVVEAIEAASMSRNAVASLIDRGWLWLGVIRGIRDMGVGVASVPPAVLKVYATGKGNAGKGAVIDAVARRLPGFETKGDDNLCDAAMLCAMGCEWLNEPLTVMPATHRRAMESVVWPGQERPPTPRSPRG